MEIEPRVITSPTKNDTPEATLGVCRSSQVKVQIKQDYILHMLGNKYETTNTQVELEYTFHPDSHMMFGHKLIEELPNAASVIMSQLSIKAGIKICKGKGLASDKSEMKQLHFRDTFNPNNYKELNGDFLKENRDSKIKGRTLAVINKQMDFISKEYSSYKIVATKYMILSCIIYKE